MKVKQIKKIFLTVIVALSFGISNQAYGFLIDYNAQWMANQGLKNAREQEKRIEKDMWKCMEKTNIII